MSIDHITEKVVEEVREVYDSLHKRKRLVSEEQLDQWYMAFRERFAPDILAQCDGPDLLHRLHGRPRLASEGGEPDDLIYWLDRKRGEAFPSARFGLLRSAAAMNAPYFNKSVQSWMARTGTSFSTISEEDAVALARQERDELLAAVACLTEFPRTAGPQEYRDLQLSLDEAAPTFSNSSWGHKYLSLISPEILDGFHGPELQWFHAAKLLYSPAVETRRVRYALAAAFRAARDGAGIARMQHLSEVLTVRNGTRIGAYWLLDIRSEQVPPWHTLFENGCVALDARAVCEGGALSGLGGQTGQKSGLLHPMQGADGYWTLRSHHAADLPLAEGDVIVASDGGALRGVGRVAGALSELGSGAFPLRAAVEWHGARSGGEWHLPHPALLRNKGRGSGQRTRTPYHENIVEIERHLLYDDRLAPPARQSDLSDYDFPVKPIGGKLADQLREDRDPYETEPNKPVVPSPVSRAFAALYTVPYATANPAEDLPPPPPLTGTVARAERILRRKGQIIFYGPPGTGKSYWAERTTQELAARSWFGQGWEQLSPRERAILVSPRGRGAIRTCCFHPAYGYEDFLEGYRPDPSSGGEVRFERRDGVFKNLCADAAADPAHDFFLVIDEINRGDVPRIFGELLAVMEKGKRGKTVLLPLTGEPFAIPENVYMIGTMNTADRSIALLDAALRRRFGFVELLPDLSLFEDVLIDGLSLAVWLRTLNQRIARLLGPDGRHIQVGHAYFLETDGEPVSDIASLAQVLRDDVIPLLEEYCYEDPSLLEELLGSDLVDSEDGRIRSELFSPEREDDLLRALTRSQNAERGL